MEKIERFLFLSQWDENTEIEWWNEGRKELNVVIRAFNAWQMDYDFGAKEGKHLLTMIEHGRQTYGSQDGGGGWLAELEKMERFINSIL